MISSGKNIKNIMPELSEWETFKLHSFYHPKFTLFSWMILIFPFFISPCTNCIGLYLPVHILKLDTT